MHQNHSRGGFDDLDEFEKYHNYTNQRLQKFSNSKYANVSTSIKIVNNNVSSNNQGTSQAKSKIAKKLDKHNECDQTRKPLESTNKQANSKKKNHEGKLTGIVVQKVNFSKKNTQSNKNAQDVISQDQPPQIEEETTLKTNMKINDENNEIKNDKSNDNKNNKKSRNKNSKELNEQINNKDDENLQLIDSKYSKSLQVKLNSHQHSEIQSMSPVKKRKNVSYKQPITEDLTNNKTTSSANSKRPKLQQSTIQSIERPEIEVRPKKSSPCIQRRSSDSMLNKKEPVRKELRSVSSSNTSKMNKHMNVTPQRSDFDSDSDSYFEDDTNNIEPKIPPKPIEHLNFEKKDTKSIINRANKKNDDDKNKRQLKELIRRKRELDERTSNVLQFQKQQETEIINRFKSKNQLKSTDNQIIDNKSTSTSDSLIPRIEQIQNSLSSSRFSTSSISNQMQSSKISRSQSEPQTSSNSNGLSNCVPLDPLSFSPKNRHFNMSVSDSDGDFEDDLKPDLKSTSSSDTKGFAFQSPISSKNKKNKNEPRSPHVTWDISNCPPIRPKVANRIYNYVDYDEQNEYFEVDQDDSKHQDDNIDYNSPECFSRAMKFSKKFLNEFNTEYLNEEGNENNFLYDNYEIEEEDTSENIPNYSRILSILNKKLNEDDYNDVLNIMNKYKVKHFCLLISANHNIEALYLLRSDLRFAKILWGEGMSKVYKDDIAKYFSINIASRKFEHMKISEFACDVDAFIIN